jgi:hypothetical protein
MRINIITQIKDISKRCKDKFNNMIENTHYKIDCISYYNRYHKFYKGSSSHMQAIKDKVSLATAWINNKYSNIDISKASFGYTDMIIHNNEELDELRRKQLNSKK